MRRYHLWVGGLIVVVFLITGQFMRHHGPPMGALSDSTRLMFRSRHIYLLASGLVNLMWGSICDRPRAGAESSRCSAPCCWCPRQYT